MIWDYLGLTRVYTKRKGNPPDLAEPVVLSAIRKGTTVKALCQNVSTHMLRDFNFGEYEIFLGSDVKVDEYLNSVCGMPFVMPSSVCSHGVG